MQIVVEKLDEVHMRLFSDFGAEQELSDFFTFQVDGYKFMPAYKSGAWDGKLRLYDLRRKTLYLGLLSYVEKFAIERGYSLKFENQVQTKSKITPQEVVEYVKWLDLHGHGKPIEARDYQLDAIYRALHNDRIMLLSPTASGKSLIIYSTMRYHLEQGRKCILIVPTTSLVEQMYSDFEDYSSNNGWRVRNHCQKLYSGFPRDFDADVLITTWQSIYKQPAAWFKQFNVIFGDEAHQFKAKSLGNIMEKMKGVRYRVGTTGTLDNKKVNTLVLEGLFGPVYKVITTRELMDKGSVANLKIKCIVLKYDDITRQIQKKNSYQQEMDFLVLNDDRNKFIINLTRACEGNTLILFQYVEKHGKVLHNMLTDVIKDERKIFFIYGDTDTEVREHARKMTAKEKDAIIIASFGVFSTGINIPSIENIIFASPSKSKIRNLQSIGRGLRLSEGKTHCTLFDISDDLQHKSWKNHTLRHFQERIKIYAEEKFSYKIIEAELQ